MMPNRKLAAAGLVAVVALGGCAGTGGGDSFDPNSVEGAFDWKRYEGTTISVMLSEHPWTDGLKERLGEFEAKTGIKVDLQTYTEDLYFDKMEQAVRSSSSPDVYMLPMDDTVVSQHSAGVIEPLTPYLENSALTAPDYDFADFPRGLIDSSTFPGADGKALDHQIPIVTEAYILFYNKDLVDQYEGGQVPTTMAALLESAKKITDAGSGDVFGSVMRGARTDTLRDTLTGVVLNQIPLDRKIDMPYNFWFDGAWDKPVLDDPQIVQGMSDYAELAKYGPANRLNLDWQDTTALFAQGKVAYYIDASTFGPMFENPAESKIPGRVGYATIPKGAVEGSTATWSWGINIAKNAGHKGAGWLFIQWATSKEMTATLGALTGAAPRLSSATDPIYVDALQAEFATAVADALETSRTSTVQREGWKAGAFVIVDAMMAIVSGGDPAEVMANANSEMVSALK
ncbi:MAG: sugar ABC transporter substrate-binding protein [Bifidobacteriaceae bacterium]|nr:sugar ABC transporter substrate-binding protein [Bifidobacteriaceae bacterium]